MLRTLLIASAVAMAAAAIYGCASDDSERVRHAAVEECLVLHPNVTPPEDSCIHEVEADIRAAQQYKAPSPSAPKAKSKGKRR